MACLEVLKELQETTLIRERLLNRLRNELSKFVRGSGDEEVVKDLIEDLRFNRRNYIKLSAEISKKGVLTNELSNDLSTLIEYNVLIALNNELELLSRVYKYVQEGRIKLLMLEDIHSDIELINDIMYRFSTILPSFKDVHQS
ncbi:MAG: hypothetical protein RMH77_06250 [Sulfolobales archaeon]|nr:hypothetical protein [Sulfolobales archaeon]MCX8185536.1 hypothetical protein [Sulfolobales archaeon]MDW7969985.1 hypothetical protein [Sulfolobales archaeon]